MAKHRTQPSTPRMLSKSEEMKSMADSMAHQMATMHPDFAKLKAGMKTQVMGIMGKVSKAKGPTFRKQGYDGATKRKGY